MLYYVLNSLKEFDIIQKKCFDTFILNEENTKYLESSKFWSKPLQRLTDNKFICPYIFVDDNKSYTVEDLKESWFPLETEDILNEL